MKDFYLWDLELIKFKHGQDSIIEKVIPKKELNEMFPKPYNPRNMPVYKLKIWGGELVLEDGSKLY